MDILACVICYVMSAAMLGATIYAYWPVSVKFAPSEAINSEPVSDDEQLAIERQKWAARQAYIEAHRCPKCKRKCEDTLEVQQFCLSERDSYKIRACPECTAKMVKDMDRAWQCNGSKPRYPSYKDTYYNEGLPRVYGEGSLDIFKDGKAITIDDLKAMRLRGVGKIKLVKVRGGTP